MVMPRVSKKQLWVEFGIRETPERFRSAASFIGGFWYPCFFTDNKALTSVSIYTWRRVFLILRNLSQLQRSHGTDIQIPLARFPSLNVFQQWCTLYRNSLVFDTFFLSTDSSWYSFSLGFSFSFLLVLCFSRKFLLDKIGGWWPQIMGVERVRVSSR